MPASTPAPDPSRCPLCGGPNHCAMEAAPARGEQRSPCWCTRARFPASLLQRVAPAARLRACICPTCAGAAGVASPSGQ